jgi:hypothetical protein
MEQQARIPNAMELTTSERKNRNRKTPFRTRKMSEVVRRKGGEEKVKKEKRGEGKEGEKRRRRAQTIAEAMQVKRRRHGCCNVKGNKGGNGCSFVTLSYFRVHIQNPHHLRSA